MKKQFYTIVELLVVIAIMALMVGIALPGVNNLINGNKVEQSIKKLTAAFDRARAEAILNNSNVALLLPMHDKADASQNVVKNEYIHSAYAIVVLKNGKYDAAQNGYDFNWEKLPGRTFFTIQSGWNNGDDYFDHRGNLQEINNKAIKIDGADAKKNKFNILISDYWNTNGVPDDEKKQIISKYKKIFKRKIKYGNTIRTVTDDEMEVRAIIFRPDGAVGVEGDLSFFIIPGYVAASGKLVADNPHKDTDHKNKPDGAMGIRLNSLTGRVRYYEKVQ